MREIRHPLIEHVRLTDVMHALADPERVAIVKRLLQSKAPLACGELGSSRPRSSMSHHFKILRDAGLIETRVVGKQHLNSVRTDDLERRFPGLARVLFRLVLTDEAGQGPRSRPDRSHALSRAAARTRERAESS